jgi:rubredoxin
VSRSAAFARELGDPDLYEAVSTAYARGDLQQAQELILAAFDRADASRVCPACSWTGPEADTIHPPHAPEDRLCPECQDPTEGVRVL